MPFRHREFLFLSLSRVAYTFMHEVTPKVVAMAVSTVITMFRILLQRSLFMGFMMFDL